MKQSTRDLRGTSPVIILDGAMGTELARRGIDTGLPLWSANALLHAPEVVEQIHLDHIEAGAQVITTDTFRTNVRTLERAGLKERARELTSLAVDLARRAARSGSNVLIAGSMAPVEDCYSPDLVPQSEAALLAEHGELAHTLADAGCDLLLVETMNTIREASAAVRVASGTGLPVWVSFILDTKGSLLSGESLQAAVQAVLPFAPQAVLVNCIPVAQVAAALTALHDIAGVQELLIGAYANVGHVEENTGWTLQHAVSPDAYAQAALGWFGQGAQIIGGCCGTQPEHIRALRECLFTH